MTPAEMRARAKELRAEARRLDKEAEGIEFAASLAERRARSDDRAREVAATMCRPVWALAPRGDLWVVKDIVSGQFCVGHPLHERDDRLYRLRDGWASDVHWTSPAAIYGRLNTAATLTAWRDWCALRRLGIVPDHARRAP